MEVIEFVWHLLGGDGIRSSGTDLVLFLGYLAGTVMTLAWVRSRVVPEVRHASRLYELTVLDSSGDRNPLDVAATHLLVEFVIGMGARPELHSHLVNLLEDRCEGPRRGGREWRLVIAIKLIFSKKEPSSEFRDTTGYWSSRVDGLLHAAESAGIFLLATVLVIDGLIVLPWNAIAHGHVDGRAVTFLILAHGFMQLLGRVHRARRAVELTGSLIRPVLILLLGLLGLVLFDLPEVAPGSQLAYLVAWLVALSSVIGLLGQLTYASLRNPHDARQMSFTVLIIRGGAIASFSAFAVANAIAVAQAPSVVAALEYVAFLLAHSASAVAIGFGQRERHRDRNLR